MNKFFRKKKKAQQKKIQPSLAITMQLKTRGQWKETELWDAEKWLQDMG